MGPPSADRDSAARRGARSGGGGLSGDASPALRAAGFFVLRTALLPFDELLAWGEGLAAPRALAETGDLEAAVAADRSRLRDALAAALERPEIRDAVFVASPHLYDSLAHWRREPESKKGQRTEKALVRYFQRMAGRATPFGLFSGCSVGTAGERTRLEIAGLPTYRRHSRLDMDYLFSLAQDLDRDPALRAELTYRPNSSLYRAAGRLRYAESRLRDRRRFYYLVVVEITSYLEATLARAEAGARRSELAAALVADDPDGEISQEDAEEYVDSLIDAQILVSDLAPLLTGPEPIHDLIERLRHCPSASRLLPPLERARQTLEAIDTGGLGASPESYRVVARDLGELPAAVELPRLFQVDMMKPAGSLELGPAVIAELVRAVELMQSLGPPTEEEGLDRFRAAFLERYGEGREVPLAEALDEECGIGFELAGTSGSEPSPLLEGLAPPPEPRAPTVPWGARCEILLRKIEEALAGGAQEIELSAEEVAKMAGREPRPRPRALSVLATLAARSPEALERGELSVFIHFGVGPSGARLLGRFCHADPGLRREVETHLQEEEALDPDALFAEVVHLPEGRVGNVLCRPLLREHEIPYLGRSGAPPERQIPVTDLRVTVIGQQVLLRSARLGRRIVPRLTSAHSYHSASLRIYRFLGKLQNQGLPQYLVWKWEPLTAFAFLPRVRCGRVVISRARWLLTGRELESLGKLTVADRFRAVQRWRTERGLPRFVVLTEWDNELPVDLENVLSIDSFVDLVRQRPSAVLTELFPPPGELCVYGPEGRFVHELLVPLCEAPEAATAEATAAVAVSAGPRDVARRSFPPGSEWLYAKLYAGTATADQLLRDLVSPLRRHALDTGVADGWFFLRYADPDWHLRVRFHGDPVRLRDELLPRLTAAAEELLADGRLWRLQLDTYEREVERYGGPAGIEVSERLFQADSEAVLGIVDAFEGDGGAEARWRLALAGLHHLLLDLGLDSAARLDLTRKLRDRTDFAHQLGERFRRERASLEALLDGEPDGVNGLAPGLAALHRRSADLAPLVRELRSREAAGRLGRSVEEVAPSFLHMHVNRMMRAAAGEHERVLYDFLGRLYESKAARER